MSKKRRAISVAALLLSETAACNVPICDPVPPPPTQTSVVATQPASIAGPTVPICDPVPPPPILTSVAATRTAQAAGTVRPSPTATPTGTPTATPTPRSQTSTDPQRPPASEAAPGIRGDSGPSRDLPLQQRLRLSIVPVPGEEHLYRVEANFPASQVVWTASGGELEAGDGSVRWRRTRRGGSCLLQAVVDAGPLGVAVAARVIESTTSSSSP